MLNHCYTTGWCSRICEYARAFSNTLFNFKIISDTEMLWFKEQLTLTLALPYGSAHGWVELSTYTVYFVWCIKLLYFLIVISITHYPSHCPSHMLNNRSGYTIQVKKETHFNFKMKTMEICVWSGNLEQVLWSRYIYRSNIFFFLTEIISLEKYLFQLVFAKEHSMYSGWPVVGCGTSVHIVLHRRLNIIETKDIF